MVGAFQENKNVHDGGGTKNGHDAYAIFGNGVKEECNC